MAILQADVWLDKPHAILDEFIWQRKDRNKDGVLGWFEYAMDYLDWKMMMLPSAIPYKNFGFLLPEHYHQSYYNACDENGDGVLNWVEFKNCLSPERIKGNNGRKLQMCCTMCKMQTRMGGSTSASLAKLLFTTNLHEVQLSRDCDGFLTPADGFAEILAAYEAPRDPSLCLKAKEIVPFPLASLKVEGKNKLIRFGESLLAVPSWARPSASKARHSDDAGASSPSPSSSLFGCLKIPVEVKN
ncbi:hypothetical protein SELMODRAFT_419235 [Selaginella moellendorffii]|uniref:EF-hand domain-containing protein n=1 Tax=Selaginella moellendorffii TaxID=88036 RepID=D8S8A1_SELML|nr:hypothetical protein SELMODRAFT_419235 [Selaginella moellendorffii]